MSFSICLLAETEGLFPVRSVRNDAFRATLTEPPSQFRAVIGFIAKEPFRDLSGTDERLGYRTIMGRAIGQEEGNKTSFGISDSMYFRIAPATRASDRLILLPPFPPDAERCALTCVESIICVSADRPFPASSRNRFSQMPRRAQRTKRL